MIHAQYLNRAGLMQAALQQIVDRFGVTVQLHLVELGDVRQQRALPTPMPQERHGLHKPDNVIQPGEANHIASAANRFLLGSTRRLG